MHATFKGARAAGGGRATAGGGDPSTRRGAATTLVGSLRLSEAAISDDGTRASSGRTRTPDPRGAPITGEQRVVASDSSVSERRPGRVLLRNLIVARLATPPSRAPAGSGRRLSSAVLAIKLSPGLRTPAEHLLEQFGRRVLEIGLNQAQATQ